MASRHAFDAEVIVVHINPIRRQTHDGLVIMRDSGRL